MQKEFLPYEPSVRLKALGFDEPCLACYTENAMGRGDKLQFFVKPIKCNDDYVFVSAPTFGQAFRWFREKYEIMSEIIWISALPTHNTFSGRIKSAEKTEYMVEFKTYEEAELACLNKLIEMVEPKAE